jgi:hypothetical protein
MNTPRFTPEELQQLRSLAAPWAKIVSKRAFGDSGPGLEVDFRTIEQIASVAEKGLTEGTLQLLLEQQAQKLPEQSPCPTCGRLCLTQPTQRSLTAPGAKIEQPERVGHCPDCRRDFFPPADSVGIG